MKEDATIKTQSMVRVKRGATLYSHHPTRVHPYKALKDQVVRVHRVTKGYQMVLGQYDRDTGTFHPSVKAKDVRCYLPPYMHEGRGLSDDEVLDFLRQSAISRPVTARIDDMIMVLEEPRVVWAGRGGYWVFTDINNVTLVE